MLKLQTKMFSTAIFMQELLQKVVAIVTLFKCTVLYYISWYNIK